MSGSEQMSNAETAANPDARQLKEGLSRSEAGYYAGNTYQVDKVMPPRTGLLRVNYYRRASGRRPFPTSCAAGISMIGITLFSLGLMLCQARGVKSPAVLTGCMLFASGLVEIISGIWCVVDNNVFGSTFMLSYGALFMSLGMIISDAFGIQSDYDSPEEFNSAYGIYLSAWTVFTFFLWSATLKATVPLFALMFLLFLFLLLYTISVFGGHHNLQVGSGVICFITGCGCFYGVYDALNTAPNALARTPDDWLRMPASRNAPEDEKYVEIV
ncbi:DEKNAAC100481 [Brettanomyces naardenensis]|uniref:DEKNAAC100481 n=1 Tax=Brettanomyces naardenensis TaxID=13370 RepID=A0A448YGG5_BRENA|nr:DEKNAAC100481 [Brettanomyces naardenensis]